jgi:hypothetical protein
LSESRYYDLLTSNRNLYLDIFFILKKFDFIKISLIFASDLYNNLVFKDYVSHILASSLPLQGEILFLGEQQSFDKMLHYLSHSHYEQQDKTRRLTKSKLIAEIRAKCTDKRKFKDYTDKFLPLARTLGMPEDIAIWYIRQNLYGLPSLNNIGEVISPKSYAKQTVERTSEYEVFASSSAMSLMPKLRVESNSSIAIAPSTEAVTVIAPNLNSTGEPPEPEYNNKSSILFDAALCNFDIATQNDIHTFALLEEEFPSREFLYFKARLKNERATKVFRYLKKNADATAVLAFQYLYEREKSYFSNLSPMLTSENGASYYHRDFIEAESLVSYVKRVGLNKKYTLKELKAIDLELMLELWRTIYSLTFAYANLTKESFVVAIHWRLPFRKELEVYLVDIDTSDSTKQDMELQMSRIFEELFGENLTNEFKQQFQNT